MLKQTRASYFSNFKNAQYCALSGDPIPDYIKNGDEVYIIDTAKRCLYDADSGTLIEQPSSGGGGSSDWVNASVTFINNTPENGEYFVDTPFGVIPIEEQETIVLPLKKEDDSIFYLSLKDVIDVESSVAPSVTGDITIEENGFEIQGDGSIAFSSLAPTEISGVPPLELEDALTRPLIKLLQHGKVDVSGTDVICNNGTLTVVDGQIVADGTPEEIVVSATGAEDQTAHAENLFAVGNIDDTQDIISGTVTRRTEAVVSDGTTPTGRYVGTVGEGNIIVKVREDGYTGEIVSFETEEEKPLNGLIVQMEPKQDLHGYDSPWPAGGGKNKLEKIVASAQTVYGVTFTPLSDGSVQVSGTSTATAVTVNFEFPLAAGTYTISSTATAGDSITGVQLNDNNVSRSGKPFTFEHSGGNVRVRCRVSSGVTINEVWRCQIESGSTATAYSPYSNECPISGWTGCEVTRTGNNIFDKETAVVGYIDDADVELKGTQAGSEYRSTDFVSVVGGQSYYIKTEQSASAWGAWYDANKQYISGQTNYINAVITAPTNAKYLRLTVASYNNGNLDTFGINYPSTDTEYHAYNGNSYSVTFPSVNIWDEEWEEGYYGSTGLPSGGFGYIRSKNYISVKPNETYYCKTGTTSNFCLQFYGEDKAFISQDFTSRDSVVTIPNDCYYLRFWRNEDAYANNISINYPSFETGYHAHTEPRTVYGGQSDTISGNMPITMGYVDLGTLSWGVASTNTSGKSRFYGTLQGMKPAEGYTSRGNLVSSEYGVESLNGTYLCRDGVAVQLDGNGIYIYDSTKDTMTAQEFKAAMSGVKLAYELATPIPIAITPTPISTLEGDNNIWSDGGAVSVYVPTGDLIERVAPQKLSTAEGDNTITVTAEVEDIVFDVEYRKDNSGEETLPDARGVYF